MEGHEVILIYRLDGSRQCIPHFSADVPLDVAPDYPHDIRSVLVSVGEESAVFLSLSFIHKPCLDKSSPNTYHSYIDAVGCSQVNDVVHVLPVAIALLGVNSGEVEPLGH